MKHLFRLFLFLALLILPALPGLCGGDEEEYDYDFPIPAVVVNPKPEERLNLRTKPDAGSSTQGKFYTGVEVDVFSIEDGWARVSIGGGIMEGYMMTDYLKLDARRKSVSAATPQITITHAGGKKIYEQRKTGAAVTGQLGAGGHATVLAVTADDWLFIYADGDYGFIKNGGTDPSISFAVPGTENAAYDVGHYAGVMQDVTLFKDEACTQALRELTRGELLSVLRFGPQTTLVSIGRNKGYVRSSALNFGCGEWRVPIAEYTAVVDCPPQERLNLRTKPDIGAPSLGKYYNGAKVIINGDSSGEWIPVAIGSLRGYMKSEFLAVSGTPEADSVLSAMPILCVTTPAGKLNLREYPDTSARSLGAYSDGTLVTLCGLTDTWAHVLVDGKLGFMLRKYLSDPPY